MTPRPPIYFRDLLAGLTLLTIALGMCLCACAAVVLCSPYLLGRWLWRKATGRAW